MKALRKTVFTLALVGILLGVSIPFVYYAFFLHLVRVPTGAMANTIIPGDCLVVKKRAFGEINRGDVIIFGYPGDPSTKYVARVIGLPNETIEVRDKMIFIDGQELDEQRVTIRPNFDRDFQEELSTEGTGPYRVFYSSRDGDQAGTGPHPDVESNGTNAPFKITANEYYVMGDNRDNSADSRYWGTVPRALVFGKPTMIYWSSRRDKAGTDTPRWDRIFKRLTND